MRLADGRIVVRTAEELRNVPNAPRAPIAPPEAP